MSNYTILDFWKPRLNVERVASATLISGWSYEIAGLETFTEAPLTLSDEFGTDNDPINSSVLLVSAAGAVGKSTLARQIAFETGAIYLDLAKSEPVGANTLSGGLVKSGLYESWKLGSTAVLIDGLDEARLRVTQPAFEAFLSDVRQFSESRLVPTVLFGRTGAAQDAWIILAGQGIEVPVLEIGYFDQEASLQFAEARLRSLRPDSQHSATEQQALRLLLDRLRSQTESDGDRFAGYAPVIQAVAERVARERNPAALVSEIERGEELVTLRTIVTAILERERGKLTTLPFEDHSLAGRLYSREEQLDRLVARVFELSPPNLPEMGAKDAQTYSTALETWVAEHPFLDGGTGTSSAVFDAIVSTQALMKPTSAEAALGRELGRGAAANPFLSEFYLPEDANSDPVYLPAQHIGIVYASLRARLSLGDTATLSVEGVEDAEEEEALRPQVEIALSRRNADRPRLLFFVTDQIGPVFLGAHVEDVDVTVPQTRVEIGPGAEAVLIAPVNLQCAQLSISTEKLIVESPSGGQADAVYLEAESYDGAQMTSVPVLRGSVALSACWPDARSHPWTTFATDPTPSVNPKVDEALRRLRKFVIAFRSHGRGSLGRYKHKIEHERMTKGAGRAILDLMIEDKILSLQGSQYHLDPEQLSARAGTTYRECMARRFRPKTIAFAQRALDSYPDG